MDQYTINIEVGAQRSPCFERREDPGAVLGRISREGWGRPTPDDLLQSMEMRLSSRGRDWIHDQAMSLTLHPLCHLHLTVPRLQPTSVFMPLLRTPLLGWCCPTSTKCWLRCSAAWTPLWQCSSTAWRRRPLPRSSKASRT